MRKFKKWKHNIKDVEYVLCPYCINSKRYKMLHWSHLKQHNKTIDNVIKEFPDIPTMTLEESNQRSKKRIESTNKIKDTCSKKYGGIGFEVKELKEKTIGTLKEKYGHDNIMKSKEGLDRFKNGMIKNYGVDNPLKMEKIQIKVSNTLKGQPSKLKGRNYIEIHGEEKAKQLIEEKRISGALACSLMETISVPQKKLYEMVTELFPSSVLNHPILGYCLDIAILDKKICIEYDGSYWHKPEKDLERDKVLEKLGWTTIRFIDKLPTKEELLQKINEKISL